MPTSPASQSVEEGSADSNNGASTSPVDVCTRTGRNKIQKQNRHIDQELLMLVHDDGKRHHQELAACIKNYAKIIEDLREKNRRLEEELSFDDHAARNDPYYNEKSAEELSDLYVEGNNSMIRLELARKEVDRLNTLIQSHEEVLAHQNDKLYELAELDHSHTIFLGRMRKMERELDRRLVKLNEKLNRNRKLREVIDEHRMERARMDEIYTKIAMEIVSKEQKAARVSDEINKLEHEIEGIEQEMENVRREGEEWERKCDRRAVVLLQKLKEIALDEKDVGEIADAENYKFLCENDIMKNVTQAQERIVKTRAKRSKWKSGQAKVSTDVALLKYQENRTYIEKIFEITGTKTVSEAEHFDRIQHVNQLAEEIEKHREVSTKLREDIGKLKQRKDSANFQRMNRIEGLRSKIQHVEEQKRIKEEANCEMQAFMDAIKPALLQFHSRIGCSDVHNDDMKQVLSDIEEKLVSILQAYCAKIESTDEDSVSTEMNSSTHLTDLAHQTSPSKEYTSDEGADSSNSACPSPKRPSMSKILQRTSQTVIAERSKLPNSRNLKAIVSKQQPYRYTGLRPPHLSMEELHKKDNMEEEYPLTYHELKVKVWQSDTTL